MDITIHQDGKRWTVHVQDGEKLIDVLSRNNITLPLPCGGRCLCGKCKVQIPQTSASDAEREFLTDYEYNAGYRLACVVLVQDGMVVNIDNTKKSDITVKGVMRDMTFSPELGYGIAVDIGTTTIAMYLVNLQTGEIIDTHSEVNAQIMYGADVVSRITYCTKYGVEKLHECLNAQIQSMKDKLAQGKEIVKTVLAGNTVMQHILLGSDPSGLAFAPFKPVFLDGQKSNVGLVMPSFSPYVGGDITSSVLACGMDKGNATRLLIDIGTNGEMVLAKNGQFYCTSVAAGPALEGSHISCGVGCVDGAIYSVCIDNKMINTKTIGEKSSIGICGSGLIDAVAVLIQEKIIDDSGRILPQNQQSLQWRKHVSGNKFILSANAHITQNDIRNVQMAKSAVYAGIVTLLKETDTAFCDVECVYLAGGLGSGMNIDSAVQIGLLPKELANKTVVSGNTSGSGAVSVLLDSNLFDVADKLRSVSHIIELSDSPSFSELYIQHMNF